MTTKITHIDAVVTPRRRLYHSENIDGTARRDRRRTIRRARSAFSDTNTSRAINTTSHRHRAAQSSSVCHTPDVPARTTQQAIATSKYRALHRHRAVAPYASSDNKHSLATPERVNHTLVATTDVLLSCPVAFRPRNRARFTINTMHPARQTNTRGV